MNLIHSHQYDFANLKTCSKPTLLSIEGSCIGSGHWVSKIGICAVLLRLLSSVRMILVMSRNLQRVSQAAHHALGGSEN